VEPLAVFMLTLGDGVEMLFVLTMLIELEELE
jgi:hypothetical protein